MSTLFACLIVLNATRLDGDDYLFQWCRLVAEQQRAIDEGAGPRSRRQGTRNGAQDLADAFFEGGR